MRISKRILAFVCALGLSLTVGGVYAIWYYFLPPDPVLNHPLLGLTGFYYKTEEVLPDDGEHDMNAQGLIEFIINNVNIGLNSSKGDRLIAQIQERETRGLHSPDGITGSNLKHIFETTASTALEFTLYSDKDTEVYAYLYLDSDLERAEELYAQGVDIVRIPVYRTLITGSGLKGRDWDDVGTAEGYALAVDMGSFYAIDPMTWAGGTGSATEETL